MNMNLWYNSDVDQWRWTFTNGMEMESGSSASLQTAMNEAKAVAIDAVSKGFTERVNCYNTFEHVN